MGSYLLLHWHAPDYHRHDHVLLLSSRWDQVVPQRTCHPISAAGDLLDLPATTTEGHDLLKLLFILGLHAEYQVIGNHIKDPGYRDNRQHKGPDFQCGFYHVVRQWRFTFTLHCSDYKSQIVCQII